MMEEINFSIFQEMNDYIEEYLLEFAKKKEPVGNKKERHSRTSRERAKLQQDISNLENKPNLTPKEEQNLANKKQKLKDLENKEKDLDNSEKNNNSSNKDNNLLLYLGLGMVGLIILGLIILFKKRTKR